MSVSFIFKQEINHLHFTETLLTNMEMDYMPCPIFFHKEQSFVPHPENPHFVKGSLRKVLNHIQLKEQNLLPECLVVTQLSFSATEDFKTILEELEELQLRYTVTLI